VETRQAIRSFILDREARNISRRTVRFYEQKLGKFCARHPQVPEVPDPIREFLRDLKRWIYRQRVKARKERAKGEKVGAKAAPVKYDQGRFF